MFEVKDLSVRGELRGAALRVSRGDVVVVHGEGASAIARAAAGLVPVTTGFLRLHGDELTGLSPQAAAALGVVYVGPAARPYADLTVAENLVAGAAAGNVRDRVERADAVLASLPRLVPSASTRAGALEEPDAAVLTVACAIARRPRLLLLDGLVPRLGAAYREVRHALRGAASEEVVTLVAEQDEPADVGEYDAAFVVRRGWLRA